MANLVLKIFIFALLWVLGGFFFGSYGDSVGTMGSMLFIGDTILGSNLSTDANDLVTLLMSFIITAIIYYIFAELITLILIREFGRKK